MPNFCHLHCHTQYSLLDGASDIAKMMDKAVKDGQKGVALTDHGNMFGAFHFVNEANKRGIKPIVGCEFYVVEDRHKKQFLRTKNENDNRYHQLMLAKNRQGYENLSRLCSLGFIEGLYSKYPRIDKELIEKYHEGLIATSCCIGAEVPQTILSGNIEKAEELLKWWLNIFGDDYYIEIQRHRGLEKIDDTGMSQEDVNQVLLGFAKKHNVKVICTNDSHYVEEEDYMPHDILLCVNTNSLLDDKKRFKFPSSDFYFKTQNEMNRLFHDVPESVDYTQEIFDKIEPLLLTRDVLLPAFPVPQGFATQDDYLRDLTFKGALRRYGTITAAIEERLNFELQVIKNSGYPGYFLIVQDFTNTAKQMGVSVGPGRGSAAGSAVAYCVGITNVDPIKYDLLFERFLNPERVSMPDIDIDFDDRGRDKVINYVIEKYGRMQVAQIVTYGTMAAKSSLRDVGRVMNVPLSEVDKVAKSFPHQLGATLAEVLADGEISPKLKEKMNSEDVERANVFRTLAAGHNDIGKMIQTARKLEGSIRNTGIHACGIIITPDDITKYVPVTVAKDSELLVSQFDNSVAESAGLLKMDFLGLKTLTIIKDACQIIKDVHGIDIDPDEIPLDDPKTYELFQRGDTVAIFQYESEGMQKHMKDLKPTTFEDLIAMNALYRPGPIAYIPDFIARKHGRQVITYDLDAMEEYLHETYGICVAGDTMVYNPKTGENKRIDQLENEVNEFYVQGVNENLETSFAKITHWVCNGRKKVLEVKLRNGSKVKLTPDHQVLTEKGWKKIEELKVGDAIATPRKLEYSGQGDFDQNKLRVLAYLLADGSLQSKLAADFISKSDLLIEEYQRCLVSFENIESKTLEQVRGVTRVMVAGINKQRYHEPNSLVSFLRELGLKTMKDGCWSGDKFVPEFVFGLNEKQIAFFLASLWDCDGCIAPRLCYYKTISPQLAYDVQTLLLRLGINSTIYETNYFNNRREIEITAYQITVYNLRLFDELIASHLIAKSMPEKEFTGFESQDSLSRELFLSELSETWCGSARGLMSKHGFSRQHLTPSGKKRPRISVDIVAPLAEVLDLPQTKRNMNVRWEEIISIEPVGEELVYDITVENIHNFVGNNIILHNCVYQEQVMLLSQKLANFTKGEADVLRKAMGKKQKAVLDKMFPKFIEGCETNGHERSICEKVWKDWEAFASYAFNKSHSTCYAYVAFHTAYLKANYPAEFMASVLSNNKDNITDITKFLRECRRVGVPVLGPDINESVSDFTVNKQGQIRFGLSALKGVGEGPVEDILKERVKKGKFTSVFDFVKRLDTKAANKKVLESLVLGGGFDCFDDIHRAEYFAPSDKYDSFIEHLIRFGADYQQRQASASMSLFGDISAFNIEDPPPPKTTPWSLIDKLEREKEVTGIYISGHPLDDYRLEVENFTTCSLEDLDTKRGQQVKVAGIVTSAQHRISQKGTGWGIFTISDYNTSFDITMFSDDYMKFKGFFEKGNCVFITGNYEARWGREDEFHLKVKEITLLENASKNNANNITLKIPVETLTGDAIDRLDVLFKKHKGDQQLRIDLIDYTNRTTLNFFSKGRKVRVDNDFVKELEGMGVEYVVG